MLYAITEQRYLAEGAVAPPPWADPKVNPCATQPRGWQLLYWPPDGKCYKIFKVSISTFKLCIIDFCEPLYIQFPFHIT